MDVPHFSSGKAPVNATERRCLVEMSFGTKRKLPVRKTRNYCTFVQGYRNANDVRPGGCHSALAPDIRCVHIRNAFLKNLPTQMLDCLVPGKVHGWVR